MRTRLIGALPWIVILGGASAMTDCALKNDVQDAVSGCDEFNAGGEAVASLNVDAKVKAFVQAAAELKTVGDSIKADVKASCVNIAVDLGVDLGEADVWKNDSDDSAVTAACNAAQAKIDAIMTA